jgi:hypothetical protein
VPVSASPLSVASRAECDLDHVAVPPRGREQLGSPPSERRTPRGDAARGSAQADEEGDPDQDDD